MKLGLLSFCPNLGGRALDLENCHAEKALVLDHDKSMPILSNVFTCRSASACCVRKQH